MFGMTTPFIIEAAVSNEKSGGNEQLLNGTRGTTTKGSENGSLFGPTLAGARDSIDAGAAIIHYHFDMELSPQDQIEQIVRLNREVLSTHPNALLYPAPMLAGGSHAEMHQHYDALADAGLLTMVTIEMGRTVFALCDESGLPSNQWVNGSTYSEAHELVMFAKEHEVPLSFGVYTPSMCYWIGAYAKRGLLPKGSLVKIWFGGRHKVWTNREPTVRNALAPTIKALDAYLEALEGVDLPWMISTQGDNVLDTEVARYAIEKGGYIRVGEEDVSGTTPLRNAELVAAAAEMARSLGRDVISGAEALDHLGVRRKVLHAA